ncbi:MAG: hypothetical protein L6Q81_10220 [Bacteroidia bacterium]|nr:hypothetical protein [Bacteroidia bacterium]
MIIQSSVNSHQSTVRRFVSVIRICLISFVLLSASILNAQQALLVTSEEAIQVDWHLNESGGRVTHTSFEYGRFHTGVKPYVNTDVFATLIQVDTSWIMRDLYIDKLSSRFCNRMIYTRPRAQDEQHLGSFIPTKDFVIGIQPIYDLQAGYDLKSSAVMLNTTGGVRIGGDIKQKFGYDLRLASGIVTLPNYQDSIARTNMIVPGWGDRAYRLDSNRYGFQHLSGNVIWRPNSAFNFQVGRDKHFWGDGHRSLFLSDVGPAFPYAKLQTTIWKLQYTSVFACLQDWTMSSGSKNDFRNKFASLHYISFNAAKWLNIGVFEGVVWQGTDSTRSRGFDPNYLNPMIFFRPVEYSLGSSDNAMLGFSVKIRFNRNNVFYSQVILDEFFLKEIKNWSVGWWANKQGVQLGYKCYNFAMVKNLLMQTEVNVVRPYTYSHGSPQQSYTNAGMPLAHPMGANFMEVFGKLAYYHNGFAISGKLVGMRYGCDTTGTNFGQNVFVSYMTRENDYGNKLFQGFATNVFLAELNAAYTFNTKFPLRISLTAIARSERTGNLRSIKSSFVMAGFSLPLWRTHADY